MLSWQTVFIMIGTSWLVVRALPVLYLRPRYWRRAVPISALWGLVWFLAFLGGPRPAHELAGVAALIGLVTLCGGSAIGWANQRDRPEREPNDR